MPSFLELACHSAKCAPPPAGTGGSIGGKAPEREFPISRSWKRVTGGAYKTISSGDYKIQTRDGYSGRKTFRVYLGGKDLHTGTTMKEAKTAVEMHSEGFEPDVKFWNVAQ